MRLAHFPFYRVPYPCFEKGNINIKYGVAWGLWFCIRLFPALICIWPRASDELHILHQRLVLYF